MHIYEKPRKTLPILFNTDMVRAIMDGKKTVTRRICKLPRPDAVPSPGSINASQRMFEAVINRDEFIPVDLPICTDDVLYVRETWNFVEAIYCNGMSNGTYNGKSGMYMYKEAYDRTLSDPKNYFPLGWKPSIHMPKDAARIFLRVRRVCLEKLQRISLMDIEAEGVDMDALRFSMQAVPWSEFVDKAKETFAGLWNSTVKSTDIPRYGWEANPWVMVIEFERLEGPVKIAKG